jgi:hypothetical protein
VPILSFVGILIKVLAIHTGRWSGCERIGYWSTKSVVKLAVRIKPLETCLL